MLYVLRFWNTDYYDVDDLTSSFKGADKALIVDATSQVEAKAKMKELCRNRNHIISNVIGPDHNELSFTIVNEQLYYWCDYHNIEKPIKMYKTIYDLIDSVELDECNGYYTSYQEPVL